MLAAGVTDRWMIRRGSSQRGWNRIQLFPKSPGVMVSGHSRCSPGGAKRANRPLRCCRNPPPTAGGGDGAASGTRGDGSSAQPRKRKATRGVGVIELKIDGIAMWVRRGADARTVAAIRELKANVVIGPTGAVKLMVATRPVDFRKGAEVAGCVGARDDGRRSVQWRSLCVQADLLGWHRRLPLCEAAGG